MKMSEDFTTSYNQPSSTVAIAAEKPQGDSGNSPDMKKESYTLSIFTENRIGVLHRIITVFTRRHLSIDSFTTSETEVTGI